ncbi:MAG: phosphoenolpyruvate carboxykinase, partial [Beduini sp.]
MAYKFNINRGNAILNFSEEFCHTRLELIESEGFSRVSKAFVDRIKRLDDNIYNYLKACNADHIGMANDLKMIAKLLLVMNVEEICDIYDNYRTYFRDREMFVNVVEAFYLFWRRLERYAVVTNERIQTGFQNVQFVDAQNKFEELVLSTYRTIEETALGYKNKIYRQITAGANAALIVSQMRTFLPYEYRNLDEIPFIQSVIIHPPFITYSKRNKRDGTFPEIKYN